MNTFDDGTDLCRAKISTRFLKKYIKISWKNLINNTKKEPLL